MIHVKSIGFRKHKTCTILENGKKDIEEGKEQYLRNSICSLCICVCLLANFAFEVV